MRLTKCSRLGRSQRTLRGRLHSELPWHSSRRRLVRRVSQEGRDSADISLNTEHSRHVSRVKVEHTAGRKRSLQ